MSGDFVSFAIDCYSLNGPLLPVLYDDDSLGNYTRIMMLESMFFKICPMLPNI